MKRVQKMEELATMFGEYDTRVLAHENGVKELIRIYGSEVPSHIKNIIKEDRDKLVADGMALNLLAATSHFSDIPKEEILIVGNCIPSDIEEVLG